MEKVKRNDTLASVKTRLDIENQINKEKHHLFVEEVRSRMLFSFLLSCGIGLYFYQQTTIENLFIWFITLCFAALNSLFLLKKSNRDKTHQHQWKHLYLAAVWGVHWGSIPLIFLTNADLICQLYGIYPYPDQLQYAIDHYGGLPWALYHFFNPCFYGLNLWHGQCFSRRTQNGSHTADPVLSDVTAVQPYDVQAAD